MPKLRRLAPYGLEHLSIWLLPTTILHRKKECLFPRHVTNERSALNHSSLLGKVKRLWVRAHVLNKAFPFWFNYFLFSSGLAFQTRQDGWSLLCRSTTKKEIDCLTWLMTASRDSCFIFTATGWTQIGIHAWLLLPATPTLANRMNLSATGLGLIVDQGKQFLYGWESKFWVLKIGRGEWDSPDIVGIFCSHIMAAIGLDDQEEQPVRGG